ncbi:hypothetical protein [Thalassospira lucentensis]|uniref:hypothetical protein n=1 Tax=Thalassospira lucentensis TaxID=168935 RepID=UPI003AA87AFA
MIGKGSAAAIAVFLFSDAGMLMRAQGDPDGSGQVDISPYLVTFMAEDAYSRIQASGRKLFRGHMDDGGPGAAAMGG